MALGARRRRRRRPRWLLIGVILTVLVLGVNGAFSARSKGPARRLAELTYLDDVRPQVERSTAEGGDLDTVRRDATRLGRAGIARRLGQVASEADAVLRTIRAFDPPRSLATAQSLLVATVAVRARAASSIRDALNAALGTGPPDPSIDTLTSAGLDLIAADRTYGVFRASLPKGRGFGPDSMPPSTWIADPQVWQRTELSVLVSALRASSTLAPVHDVSIVLITTDPSAVGSEGAISVLPAVKTMRLQVVVANVGNEPEKHVAVAASLAVEGGPQSMAREFVDLAPGQRVSVTLVGLRPAAGNGSLTVDVGPAPGETAITDNTRQVGLVFR